MGRRLAALLPTPSAVIGLVMVSIFVLVAIFAPFLAPYDPSDANLSESPALPSAEHPLGQDLQGRDELSRIIYGGRATHYRSESSR